MGEPIVVSPGGRALAEDLVESLARRGLDSRAAPNGSGWEVTVVSAADERTETLVLEVIVALEDWAIAHHIGSVPVRMGSRMYALRPHADVLSEGGPPAGARYARGEEAAA